MAAYNLVEGALVVVVEGKPLQNFDYLCPRIGGHLVADHHVVWTEHL